MSVINLKGTIAILEEKIGYIDSPVTDGSHTPNPICTVEAAFWARLVLEIIERVEFDRYGYSLKLAVNLIPDSDNSAGSANARNINNHKQTVQLKKLLGFIIHYRYFALNRNAKGGFVLDVVSDRNTRLHVCYSDFIKALRSLVLSKRLAMLALCDLSEEHLRRAAGGEYSSNEDQDAWIFYLINSHLLLRTYMKDEIELKLIIMDEIFNIQEIPSETLSELFFFINQIGHADGKIRIDLALPEKIKCDLLTLANCLN